MCSLQPIYLFEYAALPVLPLLSGPNRHKIRKICFVKLGNRTMFWATFSAVSADMAIIGIRELHKKERLFIFFPLLYPDPDPVFIDTCSVFPKRPVLYETQPIHPPCIGQAVPLLYRMLQNHANGYGSVFPAFKKYPLIWKMRELQGLVQQIR